MSVEGKVVLITGGARGMGREMVRAFLKEGAKVVATDISWTPTGVSNDDFDFLAEIEDNPNVLTGVMDITLQSHVDAMYRKTMDRFGAIDVIINNGGVRQRDLYLDTQGSVTILETDVSEWERMFGTHVFGNLRVTKRFAQPMLEKKRGSIVFTSSSQLLNMHGAGLGEPPAPGLAYGLSREGSYQPAKAAMASMAIYLAQELKPHNVAVNVMLPGHTATTGSNEQEKTRQEVRRRSGLAQPNWTPRRMRADHVAPLALHLARQDGGGITGRWIACMEWNEQNGLGGFETWGVPEDVEAARAAGKL